MSYGLRYYGNFKNAAEKDFSIEIYQKDYGGPFTDELLLTSKPVTHSWQTDEPKAPIKGSSLTLSFYNTGSLPITSFYSTDDDKFLIKLYHDTQKLFEGYLVQDDCTEMMVDYKHEISLSFNDNLGLLKEIALNENTPDLGGVLITAQLDFVSPAPDNFIYIWDSSYVPQVGVPFFITNHIDPTANASWTPIAVTDYGNGNMVVQVADLAFGADTVAYPCRISGAGVIDFYARNTLLNLIAVCLKNTGLFLNTHVYANIFETSHDVNDSFLAQTFIDTRAFISGDKFDDCYEVLTKIFDRFRLSLFQANGVWNIVRWDEIRYYPTLKDVPYFIYDSTFTLTGTGVMANNILTGFQQATYPEVGLTRSIFRPFKYVKETLNYKQPDSLILNSDLQDLGAFDSTDTAGGYQYDYYEFPADSKWLHFFSDISKIAVKTEIATGNEVERYVFQEKTNLSGVPAAFSSVQFNDIQVSAGDEMEFEIRIKADEPTGGSSVLWRFGYILAPDEGSYYGLFNTGGSGNDFFWNHIFSAPNGVAPGFTHTVLAAEAENYLDYKLSTEGAQLKVPKFPADGVLRIRIYGSNTNSGAQPDVDAIWKDIKLTITQNINDSTKIVGHFHNNEQTPVIKNNEDDEIFIDDSPRNSISGTLYRVAYSGLVNVKTSQWYRLTNSSELLRIGAITTLEQLFWRRNPRAKLEGTFYGLIGNSNIYSYTGLMDFYMLGSPDRYDIYVAAIPVGTVNIGDVLVITGSASNDGSYTVIGFGTGVGFPADSFIVDGPIVTDPGDTATISVYSDFDVSMLSVIKNVAMPDLNFVFGQLEIDYNNNSLNCTQWELCEDDEEDADLTSEYSFTYIYD